MDAPSTTTAALSEDVLRLIRGEVHHEHKDKAYETSLSSWWKEYAARKNDEEEEHVADSLLYDERCHLPRTIAPPDCVREQRRAEQQAQQQAGQQQAQQHGHDHQHHSNGNGAVANGNGNAHH